MFTITEYSLVAYCFYAAHGLIEYYVLDANCNIIDSGLVLGRDNVLQSMNSAYNASQENY